MKQLNILVYSDISAALVDFFNKYYDTKIYKYSQQSIRSKDIDLVIMHGEERGDLHPDNYGEHVNPRTNALSSFWGNYSSLNSLAGNGVPVIGIEDGAHYLTAMAGGSLIQHVTGHDKDHAVKGIHFMKSVTSPSSHTQMMYPYDLPDDKYRVLAWAKHFESDTYLNGRNEEKELVPHFLEPEIVYYKNLYNRFGKVAFQGNPGLGNSDYQDMCKTIINKLLEKKYV